MFLFSHLILQLLIKYLIFVLGWVKNHGKDRRSLKHVFSCLQCDPLELSRCLASWLAFFTAHAESIANSLAAAAEVLSRNAKAVPSAPAKLTARSLFRLSERYTTHSLSLWEREGGRHCHYLLHMWKCAGNVDHPKEESQDGRHGVKVHWWRVHHPQGPAPGRWSVRVWI